MNKGFKVCTEIYLKMYPEDFIYMPLYNNCNITSDLVPILQSWFKNLLIADEIKENGDFRSNTEITLSTRTVQDYELKTLIKKTF